MSTKRERDQHAVQMHEKAKAYWLDYIEDYKNMRLLWDPKDKHYTNQPLRVQAREKLLEKFRKIDACATAASMKSKIINMRTSYNREKKKVLESIEKGGNYRPTLWYFDLFSFHDEADSDEVPNFNTIKHFKKSVPGLKRPSAEEFYASDKTLDKSIEWTPGRSSERTPARSSARTPARSSERIKKYNMRDEEEESETHSPPPKRRIYHLLQKQEKFVDAAGKMLVKKEEAWEVQGKAIGIQVDKLDDMQRTIANKLISDTIYYGSLGKLTTESYVHIDDYQELLPESEQVESLEAYDDNSRESKKEVFFIPESPSYNDDDE